MKITEHPIPGIERILVCGAGGFIGSHLVTALKKLDYYVIGADLKYPEFSESNADEFHILDLTDQAVVEFLFVTTRPQHVYQLAADMGGADYIFSGLNDANVFYNSGQINFNIVHNCARYGVERVFYSSSACIYPSGKQEEAHSPALQERDAYPANPDSDYGWEKLMSERLYAAFSRNHGLEVRIARYHNVYGPEGTWAGGKEKAPAAFCRKFAEAVVRNDGNQDIAVYGDGFQTRSFLYIDECIKATLALMASNYSAPLNIGSGHQVAINTLANEVGAIAGCRNYKLVHQQTTVQGVRGRSSDNTLIREVLGFIPDEDLEDGLRKTYPWILKQVRLANK